MGRARNTHAATASRRSAGLAPRVADACAAFRASEPRLSLWERYGTLSDEEDALTDSWACGEVSRQFVEFLAARGIHAQLVHGDDAHHPMALEHYWVRVGDTDIDWTARQFANLEHPPLPEHADLPCPMTWPASDTHPVAGGFDSVIVT